MKVDETLDQAQSCLAKSASELDAYMAQALGSDPQSTPDPGPRIVDSGDAALQAPAPRIPQGLTQEQFSWAMATAERGTAHIGGEVAVHGSRAAGTARPGSDIDFAVRVSPDRFDELIG